MTLAIQWLQAAALVTVVLAGGLLNLRMALWVWFAWRDHCAELRAGDLVPRLIEAHKLVRSMTERLRELEEVAAKVQRSLWGRGEN